MANKNEYMVDIELTIKVSMLVSDSDSFQASKNAVKFLLEEVKPVSSFSLDANTDKLQVTGIKVDGCRQLPTVNEEREPEPDNLSEADSPVGW